MSEPKFKINDIVILINKPGKFKVVKVIYYEEGYYMYHLRHIEYIDDGIFDFDVYENEIKINVEYYRDLKINSLLDE